MPDLAPESKTSAIASADRRRALFGTAADLRLADKLPGVIIAEPAPEGTSAALSKRYGYLGFSARTGELGSPTALRLLFEAALTGTPMPAWERADGRFVDPLRPQVEPEGLRTEDEVDTLQEQHLAAVRSVLDLADEVVLVLGGAPYGRDRETGTEYAALPSVLFPPAFRERIEPAFPSFEGLDTEFTALVDLIRHANSSVDIVVAIEPPVAGKTLSRDQQRQISMLRALADEWTWRFLNVRYLPIFDVALAQRSAQDRNAWDQAQSLMGAGPPEVAPTSKPAQPRRAAAAASSHANAPVPARPTPEARPATVEGDGDGDGGDDDEDMKTVCEDELLEAFSK